MPNEKAPPEGQLRLVDAKEPPNGIPDFLTKHKKCYMRHAREFQKVFGVRLFTYWDLVTGFDLIKFDDEVIKPPDGTSTAEAVEARYGSEAVKLIRGLIHA